MRWRGAIVIASLLAAFPVALASQGSGYAESDSADAADDALVEVDPGDFADVTEALEDAGADGYAGGRAPRALFARTELVWGHRRSQRLTAGAHGLALGVRRVGDDASGWVDVRSGRWLERVTVGGLRVRSGGALVLGARRSRFGGAVVADMGGLAVDPSLTLYRAVRGVSATLRHRSHRFTAVAWESADGAAGRWGSLERVAETGVLAVSAGVLADPEAAGGASRAAVSVSGSRRLGGNGVSGEVARLGEATLAVVRTTVRAAGEWTAEVFGGAATGATGGVAAIDEDDPARERGASLRRDDAWTGWRSSVSLQTVTRRGPEGEQLRRRVDARGVGASGSGVHWDFSARYDLDAETEVPSGRLVERVSDGRVHRARVRARLDVPAGASLSLRYHAQALLEARARPGFIAGLEVRRVGRRLDLRASVTNSALGSGGAGYVARPGIAGYEVVSAAGRRGSDVSARATLRLFGDASVSLYAGVPWESEPRYLVSVAWRL